MATCARIGCEQPPWNRRQGSYCSFDCRKSTLGNREACARKGCPCAAPPNGENGGHCCASCLSGTPCAVATHLFTGQFARCANKNCACTASWNGKHGAYCCHACRKGTPCTVNVHSTPSTAEFHPGGLKCANPNCPTGLPPWNKQAGCYCQMSCRIACTGAQCANPSCPTGGKAWNGKQGSYCGFDCRNACRKGEQSSVTNYVAMTKSADAWAKSSVYYSRFYPNPNLQNPNSRCRVKWEAAVRALNATNIADDIQFAWHGTPSHSGLIGISSSSWDPGRRNGQACGPGEYFSPSDTTSKSYAGGNGFLIVCALLKRAPYSSKSPHLVVNNPTSGNPMYCIPVGVLLQTHQVVKGDPFAAGYVP